jgi:hypothetical protein
MKRAPLLCLMTRMYVATPKNYTHGHPVVNDFLALNFDQKGEFLCCAAVSWCFQSAAHCVLYAFL